MIYYLFVNIFCSIATKMTRKDRDPLLLGLPDPEPQLQDYDSWNTAWLTTSIHTGLRIRIRKKHFHILNTARLETSIHMSCDCTFTENLGAGSTVRRRLRRRSGRSGPGGSCRSGVRRRSRLPQTGGKLLGSVADPVPFGPLDPGWVKNQDPNPGWTTRKSYFRERRN